MQKKMPPRDNRAACILGFRTAQSPRRHRENAGGDGGFPGLNSKRHRTPSEAATRALKTISYGVTNAAISQLTVTATRIGWAGPSKQQSAAPPGWNQAPARCMTLSPAVPCSGLICVPNKVSIPGGRLVLERPPVGRGICSYQPQKRMPKAPKTSCPSSSTP